MTTFHIEFQPIGRRWPCSKSISILEAARDAGLQLVADCGGAGTCGRCRVKVVEGRVSPPTSEESLLLSAADLDSGVRLACQARVLGDLVVHIPPQSIVASQRLQVTDSDEGQVVLDPAVIPQPVELPPPDLNDLRSDWLRLFEALSIDSRSRDGRANLAVLREASPSLRKHDWKATVFMRGREILEVSGPEAPCWGVAFDLGTTKMAGYLMDLTSAEILAVDGVMNPQISYGEDVMSRIEYADQSSRNAAELSEIVVESLNDLIARLCERCNGSPASVKEIVIAGNTAMHHLCVGLSVAQLGAAPYVPVISQPIDVLATDLGLKASSGAYAHFLPNIAGFVGGDHVAMILATGLQDLPGPVMGIDIGTNTEVALAHQGQLFTCSCASGPAFEGAHIHHGMRAASGAIERVRLNGSSIEVATIDDAPAVGICGSGILDAVATMVRAGILNAQGRMERDHPLVREGDHGSLEAPLCDGKEEDIVVTQKDVREIQLAKGAIRTGIESLLREAGIDYDDLQEIIVAGAFGNYIDPASAVAIGLFPPMPLGRFRQVGNAAGAGARRVLISQTQRQEAARIALKARYLELMSLPHFSQLFAESMFLSYDPIGQG
jgi:uncharacterized 2Fe-2S/4Fe-4S cluster protein (DUF4445 family)